MRVPPLFVLINSFGVLLLMLVQTPSAHSQTIPPFLFVSPRTVTLPASPYSVNSADFNGDGRPDLVTTAYGSNVVFVTLNQGGGTFQSAMRYDVGTNPIAVVVSDVNLDGKSDLIVASLGVYDAARASVTNSSVSVLLGQGDGTFLIASNYPVNSGCRSVVAGDFNGDGKPDLAVAKQGSWSEYSDGGIAVLLNNGDGTFQSPTNYQVGTSVFSLVASDFNGDGNVDLASAYTSICCFDNGVSVLLGGGDGHFQLVTNIVIPDSYNFVLCIAAGDFNNDTKPDLIFGNGSSVSVIIGQGDGSFQVLTSYTGSQFNPVNLVSGDFNQDAKLDFAAANRQAGSVWVFQGNGDGTFQPSINFSAGKQPQSIALADLNSDAKPDLAVANSGTNTVKLLFGNGDGGFQDLNYHLGPAGADVAIADFDGDHKPDLAALGSRLTIMAGAGDGTFSLATNYAAGRSPYRVVSGDFNSDGKLDLAVAPSSTPVVLLFPGNGDGTFQTPVSSTIGRLAEFLAVGDFNADGKLDLAAANFSNNSVSVVLGNGDGTFQSAVQYGVGSSPVQVAVGDINGDGNVDLAVANLNSASVSVLLGNGEGTFGATSNIVVGSSPESLILQDFNGDSRLDLGLAHHTASNSVWVMMGRGDGGFQGAVKYDVGPASQSIVAGDLNGDAKADLAVANSGDGTIAVLLNKGDGSFLNVGRFAALTEPFSLAVGDFNGDGSLDLVETSFTGLAVFLNNYDSTVARLRITPGGSATTLSWMIPFTGFVLEGATNLSFSGWKPIGQSPTTNNGRLEIALPFDGAQHFYRLHKP